MLELPLDSTALDCLLVTVLDLSLERSAGLKSARLPYCTLGSTKVLSC